MNKLKNIELIKINRYKKNNNEAQKGYSFSKTKKMKYIFLLIIFFIYVSTINPTISKAKETVSINLSQDNVNVEENVVIAIETTNSSISALDLNIYYDNEMLEYVSGPELISAEENLIRYTWYDEHGGENKLQNQEILSIDMKAKKEGTVNIAIKGTGYDKDGNILDINFEGKDLYIGNTEEKALTHIEGGESIDTNTSNASLQTLRINEEGLEPIFDSNIYDYYFLTDKEIQNLEITAIPSNLKSNIIISGNTNLEIGKNEIKIEVISEDKTQKEEYKIYAILVSDLEKSNFNLENLAIEGVTLNPEFDSSTTVYTATVDNKTEELNILAIPENQNAKVTITGGNNLQIGDNKVSISVISEDGIANKEYIINVHRRTEEEDKVLEEEQRENQKNLEEIMDSIEKTSTNQDEKNENSISNKKTIYILSILAIIVLVFVVIYTIKSTNRQKMK